VITAFIVSGGFGPGAGGTANSALAQLSQLVQYSISTGLAWGVLILLVIAYGFSGDEGLFGEDDSDD
jgi:hypothetical protein